jgi:hypothetical protein
MSDIHRLANCMMAICDPDFARNPLAWHELHREGITREALQEQCEQPDWMGPKPRFDLAPAYDSPMWQFLEAREPAK